MSEYKIICKSCRGEIKVPEGQKVIGCPYCELLNTVSGSLESNVNLFNRANYLFSANEFDKAATVYEDILKQDNMDYEAHWGAALCRYGIEYVVDPESEKRVPTCHRTQYDSILNDADYLAAMENAPLDVQAEYEAEGAYIDKVQKGILALARKQDKFDVFLCYKETDDAENRSEDSVLAQELEFELTKRGYKVFFARKTLQGKLGTAYEPVIFSALHSAKVMVVLGMKPENFTAVWVKNEWSRYRELIKKGEDKTLIPAYRGISPYDLPGEFASLQALDMGKLGFVQDLCDGIDKLSNAIKTSRTTQPTGAVIPTVDSLIRRTQLFLEEGNFERAEEYIEKVLDIDPEYAPAYIASLMIEFKLRNEQQIPHQKEPLTENVNYLKALRFADPMKKRLYEGYNKTILDRHAEVWESTYIKGESLLALGEYSAASHLFMKLGNYKDSRMKLLAISRMLRAESAQFIGNIVSFGNYTQKNEPLKNQEEIIWKVLSVDEGRALLISEKNLDCKPYNTLYETVTWETSSLRKWLNNDFLNIAFTAEEQKSILTVQVRNKRKKLLSIDVYNNTSDKIFLLSIEEVNNYFESYEERKSQNTAYAKARGAFDNDGFGFWWLRSIGKQKHYAATVSYGGTPSTIGNRVDFDTNAVRPALYLNLNNCIM